MYRLERKKNEANIDFKNGAIPFFQTSYFPQQPPTKEQVLKCESGGILVQITRGVSLRQVPISLVLCPTVLTCPARAALSGDLWQIHGTSKTLDCVERSWEWLLENNMVLFWWWFFFFNEARLHKCDYHILGTAVLLRRSASCLLDWVYQRLLNYVLKSVKSEKVQKPTGQ